MNTTDGTHRIWVQPLPGGKSRTIRSVVFSLSLPESGIAELDFSNSHMGSGNCVAHVHVETGAKPEDVKAGLVMSAQNDRQIVMVKVGVAPFVKPDEPKAPKGKKRGKN